MQYLSMVRPQLVHAVISCPDKDAYKCTLLGLSLGGSEPIAKWHGSSSVHVPTHGTDESQVAVMLSNAKWADVFKKFEADKRALRGGKRRGAFAKLDASTKTKLNEAAKEVDAAFKEALKNAIDELGIEVTNVGTCVFDAWSGIHKPGTTFGSSTSTSYGSSSSAYESSSAYGTSADDLSSTYYGTTTRDSYDSGSDSDSYNSDSSSSSFGKDADKRRSEINEKSEKAREELTELQIKINTARATKSTSKLVENLGLINELKILIDSIEKSSRVRPYGGLLGSNFKKDNEKADGAKAVLNKLTS
jgi:hypothetical protein